MAPSTASDMPSVSASRAAAAYYFAIFAALGGLIPFLPLMFADRGLNAAQVGLVLALMPLFDMIAPPLWGLIADTWHVRTKIIRAVAIASAGTVLLLLPAHSFVGALLALGTFCLFRSALVPLGDAATRSILGAHGNNFGRIRVWGSVGFAGMVALVGFLDAAPELIVGSACIFYVLAALMARRLPTPPRQERTAIGRAAWRYVRQPAVMGTLLATSCYYCGHATYDVFVSLHFADLGLSKAYVGAAWSVGVATEVLVMWHTPKLLRRFNSRLLLAACAPVAAVRWALLATLSDPVAIMLTQPLHAITFGTWYVCLVDATERLAPPELKSSAMTFAIAAMGLGRLTGYLAGGPIMRDHGGATVYMIASGCAALGALLYLLAARLRAPS